MSEEGKWSATKVGTPQGAVVLPLLANGYLPYVIDLWVEAWGKKVAKGDVIVVRYTDDRVPRAQRAERAYLGFTSSSTDFSGCEENATPISTPEPSSLDLVMLGAGMLWLGGLRIRRFVV
jgi:hypothetical protein